MEEEERKQKLRAGKEKLAKFQKKKKKSPKTGNVIPVSESRVPEAATQEPGLRTDLTIGASQVLSDSDLQSLSSFSEDDTSGTEESDSRTVLLVKSELREKIDRVAELEENLVGKQLALDKVIGENEKLRQEIRDSKRNKDEDDTEPSTETTSVRVAETQSNFALVNQSFTSVENQSSETGNQTFSMGDLQELIQHVQWLQLQLKQAATTVQAQTDKQTNTAQALHEAKSDILLLQENIQTKDEIIAQLADKLSVISTEYGNLKACVSAKTTELNTMADLVGPAEIKEYVPSTNDDDMDSYVKQIDKLKEDLKVAEKREYSEKADLMKALTFVKENNEAVLHEKEQMKRANENLNEKLENLITEKHLIEEGFESAKLRLDELTTEFNLVKQEKVLSDQEILKLSEKNLILSSEVEKLESENFSKSQEIQCLNKQKANTIKEMTQITEELIGVKVINQDLENELKKLNIDLESMKLQNDRTIVDNKSLAAEIETLKSQHQIQLDQISDYQSQITDYEYKLSEASDAVEDNHSLRTQNNDLYNKINNQKDVIASLKAETENVVCRNVQLIDQLHGVSSGEELYRNDVDMLQRDKDNLEEELDCVKSMLASSHEENNKYKETISDLNAKLDILSQGRMTYTAACENDDSKLNVHGGGDFTAVEVQEQLLVSEEALRSESINTLNQTPVSFSLGDWSIESSVMPTEEESVAAGTSLPNPDNSVLVIDDEASDPGSIAVSNNFVDDLSINSESVVVPTGINSSDLNIEISNLQAENERLKNELLSYEAGKIVGDAVHSAKASLSTVSELTCYNDCSDATQEENFRTSSASNLALEMHPDDTAYNTCDTETLERGDHSIMKETVFLREKITKLERDIEKVCCALEKKNDECEDLKAELTQVTNMADTRDRLTQNVESHDLGQNHSELNGASEVSDPPHRIDASGMEVNLHASSALPNTHGFGSVLSSFVETVDDHVFQNVDAACQVDLGCDSPEERERQEELTKLNSIIAEHIKEKNDLVVVLDKERRKLGFAIHEKEEMEDSCKKYLKDLGNQAVVGEGMKAKNDSLEESNTELVNQIQTLSYENEKLSWHKNELELKLNSADKEISGIKLEKIQIETKEEEVREELFRVKERLDYLETSALDIFEMREVVDSIQIEKEEILKENEKLQEFVSAKVKESEEHFEHIKLLHEENLDLLETIKELTNENLMLSSQNKAIISESSTSEQKVTDLKEQNVNLNLQMDGLLEENSTLKTKIQSVEDDLQNLTNENEKLKSYFPNIDSQEEKLHSMTEKCGDLESHIQEITDSNEKMVLEITDLEKKLLAVSDENEVLLDKCDELANIVNDMDNEKTDLLLKIDNLNAKLSEVCEENNLNSQKKESEIEALVEENSTLKTQVINLKEELNELTEQMKFNSENSQLKHVIEIAEKKNMELQCENSEFQEKIKTLENDLLELVEQVQLYDDTISEKVDLASRLEQEINSLLEENSTLKTHNNILEHDIFEITENQNELKEQLKNYKSEVSPFGVNESLTAKLELEMRLKAKLQHNNEVLLVQNAENLSKTKEAESKLENLCKELALSENAQIEYVKQTNSLKKEKEQLQCEKADLKDNILQLESNHYENLQQTKILTAELETSHSHLQRVSDNRNYLRTQIEILAAEVETLSTDKDKRESRCSELEAYCNKLKGENEKYKQFSETIKEKIERLDNVITINSELVSKNESLCKRVEDMEVSVENVKQEKIELETLLEELTSMLHDMQSKYEEVKSEMEATKKKCDKEIKQLQTQLQTMNDDVQELRSMLDVMENEVYDAAEEKNVLKENLQVQQEQYEEAIERKQKLEELLSEKHQKDIQNKRTVCESLTGKADDEENTNCSSANNFETICDLCQNVLKRSSISTFTQTDIVLPDTPLENLNLNEYNVSAEMLTQTDTVLSGLDNYLLPNLDSDKDEDTMGECYHNNSNETDAVRSPKSNHERVVMVDIQCQVNMENVQWDGRLSNSDVQINAYIPSDEQKYNFQSLNTESGNMNENTHTISCPSDDLEYLSSDTNIIPLQAHERSNLDETIVQNIPAMNIASQIVKFENEQTVSRYDNGHKEEERKDNSILKDTESVQGNSKPLDTEGQIEGNELIVLEIEDFEECDHAIHQADSSVVSVDSGIFSAGVGAKFHFDDANIRLLSLNTRTDNSHSVNRQSTKSNIQAEVYCHMAIQTDSYCDCSATQTDSFDDTEYLDVSCQAEVESVEIESIRKELEEKFENSCKEMETEIEQKLNNKLDFRERKVKLLEDNYEKKVKQIEYDMEEKFEHNFRMREAELEVRSELDIKTYEKQLDDMANQKIEKIRMEKDQQFVETMQRVRSDLKKRHKAEIKRLKDKIGTISGMGPDGDGQPKGREQESIIHKLSEENKDLAIARDALLRRADSSILQLQALQQDLQSIMEDEGRLEPHHPAGQIPPTLLDWEIAPDLSFGSVNSSLDEKSLRGSLDQNSFCLNSNCASVRRKYDQLVQRIMKFSQMRSSGSSISNTSTPRGEMSDIDKEELDCKNVTPDLNNDIDRFVENTDPEIPMIQRITSIHLEHSVRAPCNESGNLLGLSSDQFVVEDVTNSRENNDIILDEIVSESSTMLQMKSDHKRTDLKKKRVHSNQEAEGHFSETESESETEDFSESSVTFEYDQLHSCNSEFSTGVTDKNVHPFNECKFSKSVIKRHMSENDVGDGDELVSGKQWLSDSGIISDRESVAYVQGNGESICDRSEGQFVNEIKKNSVDLDTLDLTQVSGFETAVDDVFEDSDRGISEIMQSDRVNLLALTNSADLIQEQDKFIAEMSPMEEQPPGSAVPAVSDENRNSSNVTGEDKGDFFEEVIPPVKRKTGNPLKDINFKFDSLRKEELELEMVKPDFMSVQNVENPSPAMQTGFYELKSPEHEECIQSLSPLPSEEIRPASETGSPNMFVNESIERDPNTIMDNMNLDVPAQPTQFSDGKQSYENAVFDVLNSICPGTNPIKIEREVNEEMLIPVIQNFENAAHDFGDSKSGDDIQELLSKIKSLETELSTVKIENKHMNEKLKEDENLNKTIAELKKNNEILLLKQDEQIQELEKINFLKTSLNEQVDKLKKEHECLQSINVQIKEQFEQLQVEFDDCSGELEKVKINEASQTALMEKQKCENSDLEKALLNLKTELKAGESYVEDAMKIRDQALLDRNKLLKVYEERETKMIVENQGFQEQVISLTNQVTACQSENKHIMDQVDKLKDVNEMQKLNFEKELSALNQVNDSLNIKIEDLDKSNTIEKKLLNEKIGALQEENTIVRKITEEQHLQINKVNSDRDDLIQNALKERDQALLERNSIENSFSKLQKDYELKESEMRSEKQLYEEKFISLTNQITAFQSENKQLKEHVDQLKEVNEIQKLEFEKEGLAVKEMNETLNMEIENINKSYTTEKESLNVTIEALQKENNRLHKITEELHLQIDKINSDREGILEDAIRLRDQALSDKDNLQSSFDRLQKDCEKNESETQSEKQALEEQVTSLTNQIATRKSENEQMKDQVDQLKEVNEQQKLDFNEELAHVKQVNDILTVKIEDINKSNKLQKDSLNETIGALKEENNRLHGITQELYLQIDKVNSDSENLIRKFDIKVEECKQSQEDVGKLKTYVEKLNETIIKNEIENSILVNKHKNVELEIKLLRESYDNLECQKASDLEKLSRYENQISEQQMKVGKLELSLQGNIMNIPKPLMIDQDTETEISSRVVHLTHKPESASVNEFSKEMKRVQSEKYTLESSLRKSKEINEENEWAINELASQVEELENEKSNLQSEIELGSLKISKLKEKHEQEIEKLLLEKSLIKTEVSNLTEKLETLSNKFVPYRDNSELERLKIELQKAYVEKSDLETQLKMKIESDGHEHKELNQRVFSLEKEKSDLDVLIRYNRETFDKEKAELLEMYNDLKNEVDALIENKKSLEDELCTLKELLEDGLDVKESDPSRELTLEDLEEMQELRDSIDNLKKDIKEKDHYVRKLEEHLLNIDMGLPNTASTPKPTMSFGEPVISKSFSHKHHVFHEFAKWGSGSERHNLSLPSEASGNTNKTDHSDLDHSTLSENKFAAKLGSERTRKLTSSIHSDTELMTSSRDSFDTSERIRSGLKPEEDGHLALELKQFELVDEISNLRKDFRETKAIYEQETALLTEALDREKAVKENRKQSLTKVTDDMNVIDSEKTVQTDLVRARQDIALLRKENNILRIENERWLNRIKEQEQIVLELRERLTRNTSGIEEIEEVFGKQLALLQKQREELMDKIRDRDQENSKLSITIGEKSLIEDSLRREKEILSFRLHEKSDLEKELNDKQLALEKQKLLQKHLEEVIYQKDVNERNLMKQKRLLEEELLEIESKVRDREENLGFEKNQLLDELRDKPKKSRSETSESQDNRLSVCSDSSVSDQQIGRLELMLEEVEKQHKHAVNVLRDKLQSKYDRREKALRQRHAGALSGLQLEQKKQVN